MLLFVEFKSGEMTYTKRWIHGAFLVLLLVVINAGCRKNELKQATDVAFKLDVNRDISPNGTIVFTGGTIVLASFNIEGERQEGDPINFSREYASGLSVNFDPVSAVQEIDFDLPQGVYTSLEIEFETFGDGVNSIVVLGTYTNMNSDEIPLRFEFPASETFSISAESDSGADLIVLDADTPSSALIELDPIYWFDIVPVNMLENADLINLQGVMTLLINENENDDIYDLIVDRVDESSEATFN
jgi:hypothetical protein